MPVKQAILIVDDDLEDQSILADCIHQLDESQVLLFKNNGVEALDYLASIDFSEIDIRLIVADLNMPRMGGAALLQHLKSDARYDHIKIVIYSTSLNVVEKESCLNKGAQAYLTKPVGLQESVETSKFLLSLIKNNK